MINADLIGPKPEFENRVWPLKHGEYHGDAREEPETRSACETLTLMKMSCNRELTSYKSSEKMANSENFDSQIPPLERGPLVVDMGTTPEQERAPVVGDCHKSNCLTAKHDRYFVNLMSDALTPRMLGLQHFAGKCDYCSICAAKRDEKSKMTYGFVTDHCDSTIPSLSLLSAWIMEAFWLSYGIPDLLVTIHHVNCSIYVANEQNLHHFIHCAMFHIRALISMIKKRQSVPIGNLLGGMKKKKKNRKAFKEMKEHVVDVEEPEKEISLDADPEGETEIDRNVEKLETPEEPQRSRSRQPKKGKTSQPRKQPRASKNDSLVAASVLDERAKESASRDVAREKEQEERELEKEKKMEKDKADIVAMTEQSIKCPTIVARPAMNYGLAYKGMSLFGRDVSRPYFYTTTFLCFSTALLPGFNSFARFLFGAQFKQVSYKIYHTLTPVDNGESTVHNALGDVVDTRPSEVRIGVADLPQTTIHAKLSGPARVTGLGQSSLETDHDLTTYAHDDSVLKTAMRRINYFCFGVMGGLFQLPLVRGNFSRSEIGRSFLSLVDWSRDYFSPEVVAENEEGDAQPEDADEQNGAEEDADERMWFDGPNFYISKACDGHVMVTGNGHVSGFYNTLLLGCKALLDDRSPVYYGSSTGQEVEKSPELRRRDAFVYHSLESDFEFCAQSFHNAATYGNMSSQISAETNFAMIYRKLSRYTSINQNRYGKKDLVCNAEQVARLQFWAVREAPVARASRLHF